MASNPMQRQKKVSFFLGFLTMFVISAIVIGFLAFSLQKVNAERKAEQAALKDVYVLSEDVESGGKIDLSVLKTQKVPSGLVPSNKITIDDLVDEDGEDREDLIAKVDLKQGTVLGTDMLTVSTEKITNDLRKQEFNIATLPSEIQTGDYIDVRIRFASGIDYTILSKKLITIPQIAGIDAADTFSINLTEAEILLMSSAIVDAYATLGTEIYVNLFTEPGMQSAAIPTYQPSPEVINTINRNPNIVQEAKKALVDRYNDNIDERNKIQNEINRIEEEDRIDNIDAGIKDHITRQKEFRLQLLEDLAEE